MCLIPSSRVLQRTGLEIKHREVLRKSLRQERTAALGGLQLHHMQQGIGNKLSLRVILSCVWFLASNYVCDPLRVQVSLVAHLGTGIRAPSFSVSLAEVPRVFKQEDSTDCRVWLVLDVAGNFNIDTWGHTVTDWLGSRDIRREQESCTQAYFHFVFPSCLKFAFLKKARFLIFI